MGYKPKSRPRGQNPFRKKIIDSDVYTDSSGNRFAEFNRQVYTTNVSPIAEMIKGTELDYHNTIETKSKTFEEMSYEEKIKFVNKEIDDVLDFIERNKQAKYNKYKKGFCNECNKL